MVVGGERAHRDRGGYRINTQFVDTAIHRRITEGVDTEDDDIIGAVGKRRGDGIVGECPGVIGIVGGRAGLAINPDAHGGGVVIYRAGEFRTVVVGGQGIDGYRWCRGIDGEFVVRAIGSNITQRVGGRNTHVIGVVDQVGVDGVVGECPGAIAVIGRREAGLPAHANGDGRR